jgi:integrase
VYPDRATEEEPVVKELTAAAVEKYRPGPKRRRIRDAKATSLFLVIQPSGAKSWLMRFRTPSGRIGKLTLGPVDFSGRELKDEPEIGQPLTLAAARLLAAKVHRDRERGLDVIAERRAAKHRQRTELADKNGKTFAAAARTFIEEYAKPQTRRWYETARLLGLDPIDDELKTIPHGLVERWADKAVGDIDDHDVWSVTEEARKIGVPGIKPRTPGLSASRPRNLLAALSTMFGWLHQHRKIEHNPCSGLARPKAPAARDRVLTADEIRWLWLACDKIGQPFGPIFKLLLLSGQRLREVAGMRRDELDGDMWTIPGSRTKNKKSHKVPLPPLARQLIPESDDLLFSTTGDTMVSGWSRAKARLDKAMLAIARSERANANIADWRLHDLRRTAVTHMNELGIAPHIIELVVNHISGVRAGVAGTYNRSELMPERKAALERWAAHVEGLVSGKKAKVVDLPKRGRK